MSWVIRILVAVGFAFRPFVEQVAVLVGAVVVNGLFSFVANGVPPFGALRVFDACGNAALLGGCFRGDA